MTLPRIVRTCKRYRRFGTAALAQCHLVFRIREFCTNCRAGNFARSRLSAGSGRLKRRLRPRLAAPQFRRNHVSFEKKGCQSAGMHNDCRAARMPAEHALKSAGSFGRRRCAPAIRPLHRDGVGPQPDFALAGEHAVPLSGERADEKAANLARTRHSDR
jgi:hypothetical protein